MFNNCLRTNKILSESVALRWLLDMFNNCLRTNKILSESVALWWLLDMFNNCLRTNKIPKLWTQPRIVAILKPGKDPAHLKSFTHTHTHTHTHTPVALLWHTYKLFERLILNQLGPFVDQHLIPEQAGLRPRKSCTSQLLNLTQFF